MTAADRIDANRPIAERIVEADTHTVSLDLTPIAAGLINDLSVMLRGQGHLFTTLANLKVGTDEHTRIRQQIVSTIAMRGGLTYQLGADQAQALSTDLWEASDEPEWCRDCGEEYVHADGRCEPCGNRAAMHDANYAAVRAV